MITILTSSMGLGTYVPALFLSEYFKIKEIQCKVQLIESYLKDDKVLKFLQNKEQYHKNFKVAKLGHRLAEKQLNGLLDDEEKNHIFEEWDANKCDGFIVMSGNWMDTILKYNQMMSKEICSVYAVHMDVGSTPSWCRFMNIPSVYNIETYQENSLEYIFEYPNVFYKNDEMFRDPMESYVYIHGGGWGMGTYQKRYEEFYQNIPYRIRTTIHHADEADFSRGWEYYLLDASWMPWILNGEDPYPPIGRVLENEIVNIPNHHHKGIYALYQKSCAIISKAGGSTLMDSLITVTPMVFIEPIAKHELRNQNLWISLGFGITYEEWRKTNFSIRILHDMYNRLLATRNQIPGIGQYLLNLIENKG